MSSILLIALIIISQTVIFCNSAFQSGIKNSKALEATYNMGLPYLNQFNLIRLDKPICILKAAATHLSKSHHSHNGNWKIIIAAVFFI